MNKIVKKIFWWMVTVIVLPMIPTLIIDYYKKEPYLTTLTNQLSIFYEFLIKLISADVKLSYVIIFILLLFVLYYFRYYIFKNNKDRVLKRIKKDFSKGFYIVDNNKHYYTIYFDTEFDEDHLVIYIYRMLCHVKLCDSVMYHNELEGSFECRICGSHYNREACISSNDEITHFLEQNYLN